VRALLGGSVSKISDNLETAVLTEIEPADGNGEGGYAIGVGYMCDIYVSNSRHPSITS
jgi:hypothetical protein